MDYQEHKKRITGIQEAYFQAVVNFGYESEEAYRLRNDRTSAQCKMYDEAEELAFHATEEINRLKENYTTHKANDLEF